MDVNGIRMNYGHILMVVGALKILIPLFTSASFTQVVAALPPLSFSNVCIFV